YRNAGAPGKPRTLVGSKKSGAKRKFGDGTGIKITPEIERLFRLIVESELLNDKKINITSAHRQFEELFVQHYPCIKQADIPTRRQFDHFYKREYKLPQRIEARTSVLNFQKDVRPLSGTATANTIGPGSRYEIDATIADIYLVADDDRSRILGRPILYVVVDVFSRMVVGFYIGFHNPSYVVAMQAIVNACSDKVSLCKLLGIDIQPEQWPTIGLPDTILADRGEMMSHQVERLIHGYNIRIENAPAYRGDAKGIVERYFRTLQAEFKPYAPGVVKGNRIQKHGESDYRLDAVVPISAFSKMILKTILYRNQHHVLDTYDRDADFPPDLPSIPLHIWNWGIQNRTGHLRTVNPDTLRIMILPRKKISISTSGVNLWGLYYIGSEILKEGWLHRSKEVTRPQDLQAAYDPSCVDKIYLFPKHDSTIYWECSLSTKSRQFTGMSFWQVWEIQDQEKNLHAIEKDNSKTARRELDQFIRDTIAEAKKMATNSGVSNRQRLSEIKSNKNSARENEKLSNTYLKPDKQPKNQGTIISFKPKQDESSYPQFVPGLFDDEDDQS
ncbi:MAG: transposase family protein, partial [Acinetobacter sp.]|nr:transposase family protein [Acinetobacter sp.]